MTPRDEAIQIATAFFSKLFTRLWMPWTPRHQTAIARLIDCIICAAVEQAAARQEDAFLDELLIAPAHPTQATTRRFRRSGDELFAEDDPQFVDFKRRNAREGQ